jgi:hypothetical protein
MFIRAGCGVLLLAVLGFAAGSASSGPQAGEKMPGPFEPLNATGPDAGKKACLYCRNGTHPTVMIFARELTPAVMKLIKRIDDTTRANAEAAMGSCAIFCNDAEGLPGQLAQVGRQFNLTHTILATCSAAGPAKYKIAADADVTVLVYTRCTVKANHAFKRGELTDAGIDAVLASVPLILGNQ